MGPQVTYGSNRFSICTLVEPSTFSYFWQQNRNCSLACLYCQEHVIQLLEYKHAQTFNVLLQAILCNSTLYRSHQLLIAAHTNRAPVVYFYMLFTFINVGEVILNSWPTLSTNVNSAFMQLVNITWLLYTMPACKCVSKIYGNLISLVSYTFSTMWKCEVVIATILK